MVTNYYDQLNIRLSYFKLSVLFREKKKTIPNRSNKREKRLIGIKRYLGGDKLIPLHYCAVKIFVLYILNPIM